MFLGVPDNFCFINFSQKRTVRAPRTSRTTLWGLPDPGEGAADPNLAYDTLGVETHFHANFQPNQSNSPGAYSKRTHKHTLPNIYWILHFKPINFKCSYFFGSP